MKIKSENDISNYFSKESLYSKSSSRSLAVSTEEKSDLDSEEWIVSDICMEENTSGNTVKLGKEFDINNDDFVGGAS